MSYEERLAQAIASITQLEFDVGANTTASAQLETTAAPSTDSGAVNAVVTHTTSTEQPIMSYEDELELARAIASITRLEPEVEIEQEPMHYDTDIEEIIAKFKRLSINEDDVFYRPPVTLRQCCRC